MDDDAEIEDEREIELSSISAIFPELVLDPQDRFSASIDLPVAPSTNIPTVFLAPSIEPGENAEVEVHNLSYLPSLHLRVTLPEGYPAKLPPAVAISTTPQWLPQVVLDQLAKDVERLWEELGHDQVIYTYIDHLQQAAENAFGVQDKTEYFQIVQDQKISILDFDMKAKQAAFDKETFECGVCLDPKKGIACHRMTDCGHVFCTQCLQDFYNTAITEGDITSVKCLAPNCAKTRVDQGSGARRKRKVNISPSELLQIPIEYDMVKRYVALKHKAELESDKNTIYCPRKWCQGAARTKKHPKPHSWEDDNDDGSGDDGDEVNSKGYDSGSDLLVVCEDCSFAFCRRCYQGWHGELVLCIPRTTTGELSEEDKASLEYVKLHTTPCPTCAAPAQKTHGCNHMICFKCNTHFCYLCSAWLEPGNPYWHYNDEKTGCYQRLWELEGGDGDDVGYGFAGGNNVSDEEEEPEEEEEEAPEIPHIVVQAANIPPGLVDMDDDDDDIPLPRHRHDRWEERPAGRRHLAAVAFQRANQQARRGRGAPAGRGIRGRGVGGRALRGGGDVRQGRAAEVQARAIAPAPIGNPPQVQVDIHQGPPDPPIEQADHDRAWVQRFVQMALNDEEDQLQWDSDEEDGEAWVIPVR